MTTISLPQATSEESLAAMACFALRGGRVPTQETKTATGETSCHACKHARSIPGNCHIMCAKPCATVTGNPNGTERGWFMYPINFDPVWRMNECANFEPTVGRDAVSDAVSRVDQ